MIKDVPEFFLAARRVPDPRAEVSSVDNGINS